MYTTLRRGFASVSSVARSHDDLPALKAAYWVLLLLAAMLFNAGAFAILLAGRIAFDVRKHRDSHRKKWRAVAACVLRENIVNASLLSIGVAFAAYFHASLPIVAGAHGFLRTALSVLNALVQVAVKASILHDVVRPFGPNAYLEKPHPRRRKGASALEATAFAVLLVSVALTAAAPWILDLQASDVVRWADEVIIPWRF